jgi:hypothetical protein
MCGKGVANRDERQGGPELQYARQWLEVLLSRIEKKYGCGFLWMIMLLLFSSQEMTFGS